MVFADHLQEKEKEYGPENVVYIDETGFQKYAYRPHGWALRGQKIVGDVSGNNRKCTNLILARAGSRHFAPMLFEGTCDAKVFNTWVHRVLLPCLIRPSIVVLDNAAFHVRSAIQKILSAFGHAVLFLPPYSPDLNPIEHSFDTLKDFRLSLPQNTSIDTVIKLFIN